MYGGITTEAGLYPLMSIKSRVGGWFLSDPGCFALIRRENMWRPLILLVCGETPGPSEAKVIIKKPGLNDHPGISLYFIQVKR